MITNLLIQNYALIKKLEIVFSDQFNIITGETGAGKSIMLGAIGLLVGNRADNKTLYDENEKCVVEAQFNVSAYKLDDLFKEEDLDYESICIIRREISPGGKSRAFINDTPVTLDTLKKIGSSLVDIHSQHDTLLLGSNQFQLNLVDTFAGNAELKESFRELYQKYKKANTTYTELTSAYESIKKEYDFNSFLYEELKKANLVEDEQDQLENELKLLENSEEIKGKLNHAVELISSNEFSSISSIHTVLGLISQISKYSDSYNSLKERIESAFIEIKDIASELEKEEESILFDPEKIETFRDRLSLIYKLQKKHSVNTIKDLITLRDTLEEKIRVAANLDEEIETAKNQMEACLKLSMEKATALSESRLKVVSGIEQNIAELLKELGMPNASLSIKNREIDLGSQGINEIKFFFSANKGITPQELKTVASGGEFSRLMLAVKYILARKISLPTIIFDEIDAGISGEIAIKMAKMMHEMAEKHQVVAITHLPQIASKGDSHYYVYKDDSADKTVSNIRKLEEEERILEIAKMIGGERPSELSISSAKELLAMK